MGELISLAARRAARAGTGTPPVRPRVSFYFDLLSPWTYLAAERVERQFVGVRWRPVVPDVLAPEERDVNARWQADMAPFFEVPVSGLQRLEEVFHLA